MRLNYKTNASGFLSIANLCLVSSGGTISHRHITITFYYLLLLFNGLVDSQES